MILPLRPRVAVVHLPGMNCEAETMRALQSAGLAPTELAWDRPPAALAGYDAYVLPGGFSYQDRVRAGAVAAKDPRLALLAEEAARGTPILGICNGAQILVEAGLVPGDAAGEPGAGGAGGADGAGVASGAGGGADEPAVALALAVNHMPARDGYWADWIVLEARGGSLWTEAYAPGERVPMPVAHGEGRFTARDPARIERWAAAGRVPFAYAPRDLRRAGEPIAWPDDPNASQAHAAGVTNARGNVLALMPHPERADRLAQVPQDLPGPWGERRRRAVGDVAALWAAGPGHGLFLSLAWYLGVGLVSPAEVE